MSTRRARIKAVTSLPPRRKNAEISTITKVSPESTGTPKKEFKSPINKLLEDTIDKDPSAFKPATPRITYTRTPVPAPIKNTSDNTFSHTFSKPNANILVSPLSKKDSPLQKNVTSPLVTLVLNKSNHRLDSSLEEKLRKESGNENDLQRPTITAITDSEKNKNDLDYNPPSVPESITDDTAPIDGIVPLKPTRTAPKPFDLLKNEIISDNAEVFFDPIVPLPSPSKVRPKLRPVPRLMPLRRNSVQGSASESEDESRRALLSGTTTPAPQRQRLDSHSSYNTLHSINNRDGNSVRHDSTSISLMAPQNAVAPSPLRDKQALVKARRREMSRRVAAMRRRRETVKHDSLTMYDLIFYNPLENPMIPDQEELKAKEANAKEEAERVTKEAHQKESEEESVDDEPAAEESAPVPQIKLGPNGEIILDEKSLVIKQQSGRVVGGTVREWAGAGAGGRYSRAARSADWPPAETVRFYRALAALGTDFSLIAPLFPNRTRRDIKLKFKKEEKLNGALVDKALRSQTAFDLEGLQKEFTKEREEAKRREEEDRNRLLREKKREKERIRSASALRIRLSRGVKALETIGAYDTAQVDPTKPTSADEVIKFALKEKERKRRKSKSDTPKEPPAATANYATLSLLRKNALKSRVKYTSPKEQEPQKIELKSSPKPIVEPNISIPKNIENGSLVVLSVTNPHSPSKKILQTYISHGSGNLTAIALPPALLGSVLGYMKKGTPGKPGSNSSSPQLTSPASVSSQDRNTVTPSSIDSSSPGKRKRHSSYTITQL